MPDQKESVGYWDRQTPELILIQQLHFTILVFKICTTKCLLKLTAQFMMSFSRFFLSSSSTTNPNPY